MATRDRNMNASDNIETGGMYQDAVVPAYNDATRDGSDIPYTNAHYTANRFRDRVRPVDPRGLNLEPDFAMLRMVDGHLMAVGPMTDAQANHLVGPGNDYPISTDNADWVDNG